MRHRKAVGEMAKPEIVCISGSTRFIEEMAVAAWLIEKSGRIAMGCHLLPAWYFNGEWQEGDPVQEVAEHHAAEAEGVAAAMDELHLRKIDLCDRLVVVAWNGYVGDSTRREIEYCKRQGKPISFIRNRPELFGWARSQRPFFRPGSGGGIPAVEAAYQASDHRTGNPAIDQASGPTGDRIADLAAMDAALQRDRAPRCHRCGDVRPIDCPDCGGGSKR